MELSSESLVLRMPARDDVPSLVRMCADPLIVRYTSVPDPYPESAAIAYIDEVIPAWWASGRKRVWFIARHSDPATMMGMVDLFDIDRRTGEAAVGYWLGREFRGAGVMAECLAAVVAHAFAPPVAGGLGLTRIRWQAAAENVPSWRVAERIGFTLDGVHPAALLQRGQAVDAVLAHLDNPLTAASVTAIADED
ncbi:MAG TPA: GNAT family protein [Microbacterium sp.]|nr:GNAT family protein [Microbacterium sp.]